MTGVLEHVHHFFIEFDFAPFQRVDVHRFAFEGEPGGEGLLAALIAHEVYGDDFGSGMGDDPGLHGPYVRERIRPDSYRAVDAEVAEANLRGWANQYKELPKYLEGRMRGGIYQALRDADEVYLLPKLGVDAEHEWGDDGGFCEVVFVGREARTVTMVAALAG
ncbi:hypothetical protein Afil01_25510 [Actinorhabdospora filicis]|uniref:Uncharacterized protein n=1 Tax=Actinorhabdospora filicis TaxID=1785913 RepID=A0A9W6SIK4_9ACTN|nr:hypothetical protein [Actinorhabdospora filicis]GLZ77744.1 hypothetical protein Afil01_25510 [Actinorhabdospora filicis]